MPFHVRLISRCTSTSSASAVELVLNKAKDKFAHLVSMLLTCPCAAFNTKKQIKQSVRMSTQTEAINHTKTKSGTLRAQQTVTCGSNGMVLRKHVSLKHKTLTMDNVGTGRSENGGVQRTQIQSSTSEDNI